MENITSYSHDMDIFIYPFISVVTFGILGNSLVVISMIKQRRLLKSNYYFVVLQLAICDLTWLLIYLFKNIREPLKYKTVFGGSFTDCLVFNTRVLFLVGGIGMMLIIAVLRHRAVVHPLKPAISRRKLRIVCGLVYIVGLGAGYGPFLPSCFLRENSAYAYRKFHHVYHLSMLYLVPTTLMGVIYCKIFRNIMKENTHLKRVCSNMVQGNASSSMKITRSVRNRRITFVCFVTVFCYAVLHLPIAVWYIWYLMGKSHILTKLSWVYHFGLISRVAGAHAINPLIYGLLDKKLLIFWKLCRKGK